MPASFTAVVDTTVKVVADSGDTFPARALSPSFAPGPQQYANGTNASQINIGHMSRQSVANGTPVSLDLSGGTLKDYFGNVVSYAEVATLAFINRGTAGTVTLTGNFITSRFGASASIPLAPGGRFVFDDPSAAGLAVTNSSADVITLTSSAGTNPVDVVINGRDA